MIHVLVTSVLLLSFRIFGLVAQLQSEVVKQKFTAHKRYWLVSLRFPLVLCSSFFSYFILKCSRMPELKHTHFSLLLARMKVLVMSKPQAINFSSSVSWITTGALKASCKYLALHFCYRRRQKDALAEMQCKVYLVNMKGIRGPNDMKWLRGRSSSYVQIGTSLSYTSSNSFKSLQYSTFYLFQS